jgi:hypothetical protein
MLDSGLKPALLIGAALGLIPVNAPWVTAEFAFVRVRRTRLKERAGQGEAAAKSAIVVVIEINDSPNLDVGAEDKVPDDELYRRLLARLLAKFEGATGRLPTNRESMQDPKPSSAEGPHRRQRIAERSPQGDRRADLTHAADSGAANTATCAGRPFIMYLEIPHEEIDPDFAVPAGSGWDLLPGQVGGDNERQGRVLIGAPMQ